LRELSSTEWLREFQKKLHAKAKAEPKFRFYSLYDKTYRMDVLEEAYRKAKANGGTGGVDGETFDDVEKKGVAVYLAEVQFEMKERRYEPRAVRRVYSMSGLQESRMRESFTYGSMRVQKGNRVMVCLSGTLARKGRSGQGSQDLHTTTLLSYSTVATQQGKDKGPVRSPGPFNKKPDIGGTPGSTGERVRVMLPKSQDRLC
jgi:hypothetical protein